MLNEKFVILGTLIMIFGDLYYFVDTFKGRIKPNKVTWFLWSLAPLIAFFAEIKQGVGLQSLLTLSVGLTTLAILLISFINKNAQWKITKFDIGCGALSLGGLLLWYITKVGDLAIFFSVLADLLAAIPTLVKAYKFPETERYSAYLGTGISGAITLLTIRTWNFATYGFPLYTALINTTFFLLIKLKLGKKIR